MNASAGVDNRSSTTIVIETSCTFCSAWQELRQVEQPDLFPADDPDLGCAGLNEPGPGPGAPGRLQPPGPCGICRRITGMARKKPQQPMRRALEAVNQAAGMRQIQGVNYT